MKAAALFGLVVLASCSSSTTTSEEGAGANPSPASGDPGSVDPVGGTTSGPSGSAPLSDAGAPPATDADRACTASAVAVCAKLETCTPFGLRVLYGDASTCERRLRASCLSGLALPGTSATAQTTATCAVAMPSVRCEDFLAQSFGPACETAPGQLPLGAPCVEGAQCASTFCARAADAACGTCAAPTKPGDPCVNQACSRGTVCPQGGTTCIVPGKGRVGDACTRQEDCDSAQGVGCNPLTKRCLALAVANAGERCGTEGSRFVLCAAGGACSSSLGGTCSAAAADGAACSTAAAGPRCMSPAICSGGTCKPVDGASCR